MQPSEPIKNSANLLSLDQLPWLPQDLAQNLSVITIMLREDLGAQVKCIGLYGSWQRGDARPDSDVDLAVFLNHEVTWFDSEKGIVDRSEARKDHLRWHKIEKRANADRLDARAYSIAVITPAMLAYYAAHGPIHLQNWAHALKNCYTLWEAA